MINEVNIIFYIQNGNVENVRKMVHSVLLQTIQYKKKGIVYGQLTEHVRECFKGEIDCCFIECSGTYQSDYEKIVKNLTGEYFTVITDNEEWIDEFYLQRAIDMLKVEKDFSMYGANTYDKNTENFNFDLQSIHCDGLYDESYQKYINYGIDDLYYHLILNNEMQIFIIPQAIVYRNYINAYEELFNQQEDIVLDIISLGQMFYFANLKYGMSILSQEVVSHGIVDKLPKWKKHIIYAMMVYAIRNIYKERNPRWTSEYLNIEYLFCIKELREEIKNGYVLSNEDAKILEFLDCVSKELPKGNQFVIKSLGDNNPEKIILLLEFERRCYGLFATVFLMLGAFKFADDNNLIPVIDFKNHYVKSFQNSKKRFKENAWEYYFEQPVAELNLEEAYTCKNVMLCDEHGWCSPTWYDLLPTDKSIVSEWNSIISKYLRLQPEVQNYIEESYQRIFSGKENVLGVSVRAGYIRQFKNNGDIIKNHPIQLEISEMINLIEGYMKEWKCDWVFLVADDMFYFEEIKKVFKDKCLFLERYRGQFFTDKDMIGDIKQVTRGLVEQGIVKNNIDYICETYLLARCNSLLAGNCGCSRMAYFLNNNQYDHVEIINKGKY